MSNHGELLEQVLSFFKEATIYTNNLKMKIAAAEKKKGIAIRHNFFGMKINNDFNLCVGIDGKLFLSETDTYHYYRVFEKFEPFDKTKYYINACVVIEGDWCVIYHDSGRIYKFNKQGVILYLKSETDEPTLRENGYA